MYFFVILGSKAVKRGKKNMQVDPLNPESDTQSASSNGRVSAPASFTHSRQSISHNQALWFRVTAKRLGRKRLPPLL